MPFQSEKQKKWMWANKPEMAREWTSKYGSKIEAKKGTMAKKDKNWIQKATKNMRKDKPCTGKKFGGPTCPPGTRRYNLAKTFRKMNKAATGTMVKADTGTWITKKTSKSLYGAGLGTAGLPSQVEPPKTFGYQKYKTHHGEPKDDSPWIKKKRKWEYKSWIKKKEKPIEWIKKKEKPTEWIKKKEKPTEWIKKKEIVGDQTKGGTYTPGWKPQLSVRRAKTGKIFDNKKVSAKTHERFMKLFKHRETGGWKEAKEYKKYLTGMAKATSSRFPANAFTAGKTALGAAQLKAHLKTKLPKGATTTLGGTLGKAARIAKATRYGKIALGVAGAGLAAKEYLKHKSKKKVQKKATGGEIIIGRGVDIDLL